MNIDQRLRDEATHLAAHVPTPPLDQLRQRARHRRAGRLAAPLVTVLAVVGAILVVDRSSTPRPAGPPGPAPVTTATPRPVPTGSQVLGYHGVEVLLPATWKLGDFSLCTHSPLSDTAEVRRPADYGSSLLCSDGGPPGKTVVTMSLISESRGAAAEATRPPEVVVDGHPGRRFLLRQRFGRDEHWLLLPDRDVLVSVRSPDPALVEQLLGSVRIVDVDQAGCSTRGSLGVPSALPPGDPTGAVLCTYDRGWINSSLRLDAREAEALRARILALPDGVSVDRSPKQSRATTCGLEMQRGMLLRFHYDSGAPVTMTARLGGCGSLAIVGGPTSKRVDTGIDAHLMGLLHYPGRAFIFPGMRRAAP